MPLHINDVWTWRATYRDGSTLNEFDAVNTIGRGFAEVDGSQVTTLELLPLRHKEMSAHKVDVPEGATPVFFRRRTIALAMDGGETGRHTTHCIGWKHEADAEYLFVFEDGSTLLSNDVQAV